MELKTLKDLNLIPIVHQEWNSPDDAPPISIDLKPIKEDLRQEAIKWIKEFEEYKRRECGEEMCGCHYGDGKIGNGSQEEIMDWIKHFFNITEDDLK